MGEFEKRILARTVERLMASLGEPATAAFDPEDALAATVQVLARCQS